MVVTVTLTLSAAAAAAALQMPLQMRTTSVEVQRPNACPLPEQILSRRSVLLGLAGATSALATAPMGASWANTLPDMQGTMKEFDDDETKRAKFQEKQKAYKKAWRKELANLEYATSDQEAMASVKALVKMVRENNNEIPQGIRKMDLDQVYKRVRPNLSKDVRLAFLELDRMVGSAVTVKDLRGIEE